MIPSSVVSEELGLMMKLAQQGFHCSEVLLLMGLHGQGKDNPDLIRAISALAGGVGHSGDICGALTGGACLLGLFAGRGSSREEEDPRLRMMIGELMEWFGKEQEERYGGTHCRDIIGDDPHNIATRCPRIVGSVYRKVRSILEEYGFQWQTGSAAPHNRQLAAKEKACPYASAL